MITPESGRNPDVVSVIVPTYYREKQEENLYNALVSIRNIEGPDLQVDLIVSDNGSSKEALSVASEFDARIVKTTRTGPAAARNAGLHSVQGEYVAFLDDDDVWLPGHIRPHVQFLKEQGDYGAVVGKVQSADWEGNPIGNPWPESLPDDGDVYIPMLSGWEPQSGATVVRKSVVDRIGEQDQTKLGGEDWDWHLRIAEKYKVGFVPEPCVLFRQHPVGTRDDLDWKRYEGVRRTREEHLRNARGRLSPWQRAMIRSRSRGFYAGNFLQSAAMHANEGKYPEARLSLSRAAHISPLHTVKGVILDKNIREAAASSINHWR